MRTREAGTPERSRGPRADARRSIAAILDAGEQCLTDDPEASTTRIARAAGVGRVTLYGHFPSRKELVEAIFARVMERTDETLSGVDLDGDPDEALRRLVASSWRTVHRFRSILAAAQRELPPSAIREHHQHHQERLAQLLARGQRSGVFRQEVPADWLVAASMAVMHAAAEEVLNGRLAEGDADRAVVETVLGACRAEPRR